MAAALFRMSLSTLSRCTSASNSRTRASAATIVPSAVFPDPSRGPRLASRIYVYSDWHGIPRSYAAFGTDMPCLRTSSTAESLNSREYLCILTMKHAPSGGRKPLVEVSTRSRQTQRTAENGEERCRKRSAKTHSLGTRGRRSN